MTCCMINRKRIAEFSGEPAVMVGSFNIGDSKENGASWFKNGVNNLVLGPLTEDWQKVRQFEEVL